MVKAATPGKTFLRRHRLSIVTLVAALLISILFLVLAQFNATQPKKFDTIAETSSKLAYVDPHDATNQVMNFYKQYSSAKSSSDFRTKLVEMYGDKNLSFYAQYYQHGFDPITCSTAMPFKVTASLVSTGPVAHVDAIEEFPDGTKQTIKATVVLNDKLAIDSIACPGAKGNLPPAS